jgi:tRNA (guanine37-N1)-methyltransferase
VKIHIVTIFPGMFEQVFAYGMVRLAMERQLASIQLVDLRAFTSDVHRTVDDRPFGGGAGMVLKPEPICLAVDHVAAELGRKPHVILLSAQGKLFTQQDAQRWSRMEDLLMICGRYEGVDERIAQHMADEEICVGDYVLSGGEFPAMLLADAVIRLLPGVIGNEESVVTDSFSGDGLGWPSYTRPPEYRSWKVPEILLSGDHDRIRRWRNERAREKTARNRPDLLVKPAGAVSG